MRGRRHKLQVSTFPFLAVLLCAMGSLILILLVMDRKAHRAALARAQREAARLVEESARSETAQQAERERRQRQARADWERKRDALHAKLTNEQMQMQLQMRKVREQLQQIAARLHYEQDTRTELRRKVEDERGRLQAEEQLLRTLRSTSARTAAQSQESSQTLRRMTLDVLQMEQALKDLKASRQREQKTFSVVPYHGRRGENRRPLYVECTAEGVVFHPERKAMSVASLIPGVRDPAGDVRAEVERRIARQRAKLAGLPGNADSTPYLLLLLRPGGVNTYHLFQAALKGLPLDFGYEFIDDDWVLDFPADDEIPSAQPWMIATKTPARPTPPPAAVPSPSRAASDRRMGLAPMGDPGGSSTGDIRGFRASETGGAGNWVRGSASKSGAPGNGMGGGSAGTGHGLPGGVAGGINSSPSARGVPGRGGGEGVGGRGGSLAGGTSLGGGWGATPVGSPAGLSNNLSGPSGVSGSALAGSPGGGEPGSPSGGLGVGGGRGNGRGHPAALAPSFREGEGEERFSGDGPSPGGFYGGSGALNSRGSGPSGGYGGGLALDGSSGAAGADLPGLGPPRALSSGSGEGYPGGGGSPGGGMGGSGMNGSGLAGTGMRGNGVPGNAVGGAGSAGSGAPGSSPAGASSTGSSTGANGSGGNGYGQAQSYGTAGAGMSGTANPGTPGSAGASPGTLIPNGINPGTPQANGVSSGAPGSGVANPGGTQGASGASVGGPTVLGGSPSAPGSGGGTPGTNGPRTGDVVIFVDPLTGKPTTAPRPAPAPADGSPPDRPPEESENNRGAPRVRVIAANAAANRGGAAPGDEEAAAMNRFAPTPSVAPPPRRLNAPRPAWVHGGRDWIIYVECRADGLVLYPSQRTFSLAQATSEAASNPLLTAIQQMIDRRQSSRRPGEPPYRPQLCLLVRPEFVRTFLTVYPALEALPVPKTRRNLDADDDVIGIVTGAIP